jgi:hypothetical protein
MVIIMSFTCHGILYYLGMNPSVPAGTIITMADWVNPIPAYYPVAYIAAITSLPLGMAMAAKISGFDPRQTNAPQDAKLGVAEDWTDKD